MQPGFIIAIDGPVAAGKGTIAPLLAHRLDGFYLWTGAMYRCLALFCIEHGIDSADTDHVVQSAEAIASEINFIGTHVHLKEREVTHQLKEVQVARLASIVAAIPQVREIMVSRQQEIGAQKVAEGLIVVAEGRDTGTRVFPTAQLKIFLTATAQVRAKRRLRQYHEQGEILTYEEVLKDTQERDRRDQTRATDPLVKDPKKHGYVIVNDSDESKEETLKDIMSELEKKGLI